MPSSQRWNMRIKLNSLTIIILLFGFFLPSVSMACSCTYGGKFSEYSSKSKGVIRAKIKSYGPRLPHGETLYESMVVEVIEVIKGKYKNHKLTLLGDPGFLCRDYVNAKRFGIESEHLFSLANEKTTQPLGGCGESSVVIKGNIIEGNELIEDVYKPYTMSVADFIELLKVQ